MRIHHLAFRTGRLDELAHFYGRVLGLRRMRAARERGRLRSVWLEAGRAILMLERAEAGEPAIPRATRELVAFAVGRSEHQRLLERLRRAGIPVEDQTPYTSYFRDPDGRRVGISHFDARSSAPPRDAGRKKRRAPRKAM